MSDTREEWKDVPEWPGYQISNLGQVRSCRPIGKRPTASKTSKWRILKGGVDKDGYRKFIFTRSAPPYRYCIRLCSVVCSLFHGSRPEGCVASHLNGNNQDDRACNLAWKSQKDNIGDKVEHGTSQRGTKHGYRKFGEIEVLDIKRRCLKGESKSTIAKEYDTRTSVIGNIVAGRTWAWLDPGTYNVYPETPITTKVKVGEDKSRFIQSVIWLKSIGLSSRDIGIMFNCGSATVNRTIKKHSEKDSPR